MYFQKNKKKIEHSQELISESIKGEDAKTTTVSQKEEKPDEKENSKKDESKKNETKNIFDELEQRPYIAKFKVSGNEDITWPEKILENKLNLYN